MPFTEPSPLGDVFVAFLSILWEGAPYIFFGTVLSGFINAYLPAKALDRVLPRNQYAAIMLSGLMGAVLPVCECAVVPVIRRLVQKGLPVSCAITYMLSAPIINPITVISTYSAFGGFMKGAGMDAGFMTSSRLLMAYFITVLVGFIVAQFSAKQILRPKIYGGIDRSAKRAHDHDHDHEDHDHDHSHDHGAGEPEPGERLTIAMSSSMRDFLDTAMFFTIGVMITSVFNTQFPQAILKPVASNDFLAVPTMMGLGFVLSLCSTSDAFIAATMGSFSYVAKLAFLVFGPMMDVKLVFMYLSVFRRRFVLILTIGLFVLVGLLCIPWSLVKERYDQRDAPPPLITKPVQP